MPNFIFRIIIFLALFFSASVSASWHEIRSTNFRLVGDIDVTKGERLVNDLEQYRNFLTFFYDIEMSDEEPPVVVYAIKSQKIVSEIVPNITGAGGGYRLGLNGAAFIINVSETDSNKKYRARLNVAFHEYAHHFFNQYFNLKLPLWYNEGLATYLSSVSFQKGSVTLGKPSSKRIKRLINRPWEPFDILLGIINKHPYSSNQNMLITTFYDHSWLVTHYLHNDEKLLQSFGEYIIKLNEGVNSLLAFKQAFKITIKDFEALLKTYLIKSRFSYRSFSFDPIDHDVAITKLSSLEAELELLNARSHFLNKKSSKTSILNDYKSLMSRSPLNINAMIGVVESQVRLKQYGEAKKSAIAALKHSPDDARANTMLAVVYLEQLSSNPMQYKEQMDLLRWHLFKAIEIDPHYPRAYATLTRSYVLGNDNTTEALRIARLAQKKLRNNYKIRFWFIQLLLRSGNLKEATKHVNYIRLWDTNLIRLQRVENIYKKYLLNAGLSAKL